MDEEILEEKPKKSKKVIITNIILNFFLIIAVLFAVFSFTSVKIEVDGSSMYPTYHNKDLGYTNKLWYRLVGIKRFDIIIFKINDVEYIKRIIGLPGETIRYEAKNGDGTLFINEKIVEETFLTPTLKYGTCNPTTLICNGGYKIADDEYFVMGDNRPDSSDSRIRTANIDQSNVSWHITKKTIIGIGFIKIKNG